jgi:hypothetical protein
MARGEASNASWRVGGIDNINIQGLGQSWNKARVDWAPARHYENRPMVALGNDNGPLPTGRAVDYRDMEACNVRPYFYYPTYYAH